MNFIIEKKVVNTLEANNPFITFNNGKYKVLKFLGEDKDGPPRKRYEGKDSEEVEKMLYYMEHSMLVRFAVLEFFFKYKNENEKFIKKEWE